MNTLPVTITFTGVDEHTDLNELASLSARFPVEWGVLFSPKRQGSGRYPDFTLIGKILQLRKKGVKFAAHLCGQFANDVIDGRELGLSLDVFDRAQINSARKDIDPARVSRFAAQRRMPVRPILQCRGDFPTSPSVSWLFDTSGGRGESPAAWPTPPCDNSPWNLCGYAGGLNPSNVSDAVQAIGAHKGHYWIDMETGVRNEDDHLDLSKCRAVCETVYGSAASDSAFLIRQREHVKERAKS